MIMKFYFNIIGFNKNIYILLFQPYVNLIVIVFKNHCKNFYVSQLP